ncbi:transketolase family protein [Paenibacillus nicotianae]|uniref:Transketolase family protein n=1 Tax=Paenibacillus nicotianae TaxID=1526551 RepID=A0ABW4UTL5_9BACL
MNTILKDKLHIQSIDEWREHYKGSSRAVYRLKLQELASRYDHIYCLDSDMGGLESTFGLQFPDRFIQVGIAEANMMSIAAGMAAQGNIPFVNTMATFATTRACEQIKVDIAYNNLPVKIIATHSGVSAGYLGPTHHALEDIAIMRALPNMQIMVPADSYETAKAIEEAVHINAPVYIRLGRDEEEYIYKEDYTFTIGQSMMLKPGKDISLIATGMKPVNMALKAHNILADLGIEARVINMHTIKPIDQNMIIQAANETKSIVTIEEHNIIGGLGSAVTEVTSQYCPIQVIRLGFEDIFCEKAGNHQEIYDHYHFDVNHIVKTAVHMCTH